MVLVHLKLGSSGRRLQGIGELRGGPHDVDAEILHVFRIL